MISSPGSVRLARAYPLTKGQAMEFFRQTRSSYGPPYPLGRWSSVAFAHRGRIRIPTHRSLLVLLCVLRNAPGPASAQSARFLLD